MTHPPDRGRREGGRRLHAAEVLARLAGAGVRQQRLDDHPLGRTTTSTAGSKKLNPETSPIMFGTNDLGSVPLEEYEEKPRPSCTSASTTAPSSSSPPSRRGSGLLEKSRQYADVVRRVAGDLKVPLCDYFAECLKRRPDDWDGAADRFKEYKDYDVPTILARDGVHPSNPKKYAGDYSEEGLQSNGFVLRNYVTLLELRRGDQALGLEEVAPLAAAHQVAAPSAWSGVDQARSP